MVTYLIRILNAAPVWCPERSFQVDEESQVLQIAQLVSTGKISVILCYGFTLAS